MIKRFITLLSDNSIVLASLFISILALYLTTEAQRDDRTYKELMIRPRLQLFADQSHYGLKLGNTGLGPAEVRVISYYLGGKCTTLTQGKDGTVVFDDSVDNIQHAIISYFVENLLSTMPWKDEDRTNWANFIHIYILFPGAVVGPGKEFVVFEITPSFLTEFASKLDKLGPTNVDSFRKGFSALAFGFPLGLKYCSMSGQYCQTAQHSENLTHCPKIL